MIMIITIIIIIIIIIIYVRGLQRLAVSDHAQGGGGAGPGKTDHGTWILTSHWSIQVTWPDTLFSGGTEPVWGDWCWEWWPAGDRHSEGEAAPCQDRHPGEQWELDLRSIGSSPDILYSKMTLFWSLDFVYTVWTTLLRTHLLVAVDTWAAKALCLTTVNLNPLYFSWHIVLELYICETIISVSYSFPMQDQSGRDSSLSAPGWMDSRRHSLTAW